MDAETLAKAVEPFFSTKAVGKGTGLGLSMVFGLAQQSGGALRLESAPSEGTTAKLWLPIATEAALVASRDDLRRRHSELSQGEDTLCRRRSSYRR